MATTHRRLTRLVLAAAALLAVREWRIRRALPTLEDWPRLTDGRPADT